MALEVSAFIEVGSPLSPYWDIVHCLLCVCLGISPPEEELHHNWRAHVMHGCIPDLTMPWTTVLVKESQLDARFNRLSHRRRNLQAPSEIRDHSAVWTWRWLVAWSAVVQNQHQARLRVQRLQRSSARNLMVSCAL